LLIARLVVPSTSGGSLLLGPMQVWITNVIGFGLLVSGIVSVGLKALELVRET